MDEPTTGLDPEVRARLWREISRLAREEGLTVVLTTHYMEEADERAAPGLRSSIAGASSRRGRPTASASCAATPFMWSSAKQA